MTIRDTARTSHRSRIAQLWQRFNVVARTNRHAWSPAPLDAREIREASPANRQTPVFQAHGTADPMVVLARGEASRDALQAMAYPVQWHTYPMQHSVHPRELQDIGVFLQSVLGSDEH